MAEGRYHWSNCAYPAVFFKINGVASVPWLGVLLHPGWITFISALIVSAFLVYVEVVKKMTLRAFIWSLNLKFTGRVKATTNLVKEL
jgi:hypothetical protein